MTSVPDVVQFVTALLNGELLKSPTRQLMRTPQRLAKGTESDYAMGWTISKWKGNPVASHSGGQPGFSTLLYILPKRGFAVILLTNLDDSSKDLNALAKDICEVKF